VGWIPFLGERISGALAFGALFISVAVVGVATVAVKYFWLVAAVLLLLIVFFTWRGFTTPRQRPGSVPLPPAPLPPAPLPPAPLPPPPPPA
jgi:hypothetical protein